MSQRIQNDHLDTPIADVEPIARQLTMLSKVVTNAIIKTDVKDCFSRLIRLDEKRWEADKSNPEKAQYRREVELAIHLLGPKETFQRLSAEIRLLTLCTEKGGQNIREKIPGIEIIQLSAKPVVSDRFEAVLTLVAMLDATQNSISTVKEANSWVSGAKTPAIPTNVQSEVKQHNSSAKPELPFDVPFIPTPLEPWDKNSSVLTPTHQTPHQEQPS